MPSFSHPKLRILPPAAALLWLTACISPHGARMQDTDPRGWRTADPVKVAYENTDTVSRREIRTVIRLQRNFGHDRLDLEIVTIAPNGLRWRDTVQIPTSGRLPERNNYAEIEQPYRRHVTFDQPGRYLFTLAPVVSDLQIEGVTAAGINIVPE